MPSCPEPPLLGSLWPEAWAQGVRTAQALPWGHCGASPCPWRARTLTGISQSSEGRGGGLLGGAWGPIGTGEWALLEP